MCTCVHTCVIPTTVWVAMCLPGTRFLTSHLLMLFVPIILWFSGILQPCSWNKSLLLLRNPAQMADAVCTGSQKAVWKISSVFRCQTQWKSPEWTSQSSRASHSSRWRCEREYEESKNHSKQTQEPCGNIYTLGQHWLSCLLNTHTHTHMAASQEMVELTCSVSVKSWQNMCLCPALRVMCSK